MIYLRWITIKLMVMKNKYSIRWHIIFRLGLFRKITHICKKCFNSEDL